MIGGGRVAMAPDRRMVVTSSLCCMDGNQRLVSGRARELAVLRDEWQRSTLGELRVALVLGDPGLGKTRLAADLVPHSAEFPVGLLAHSCLFRSMPPLGPWADTLGLRAGVPNGDRACQVCGSGLGHLPPLVHGAGTAHNAASCADALRYHLIEWIPGLLAAASRDRPIVLVLDDVHCCDDAVWEMLLRLAWDYPTSRLFVLATARPAELSRNSKALEVLHALEQEVRICRVALAPFSRHDIGELIAHTLRRDPAPSVLVDWLMARTQGNPRFAVGLLEALSEREIDLHAPALGGLPERLVRWIRTELARLDSSALAVLELLAVAGDAMDPDDLARITGEPAEHVAIVLEELSRAGTVVEQQREGSLGYAFTQVLTREVLYADIGAARRRVMHQRVAATLLASGRTEAAASHYIRAAQAGDGKAIVALIELVRRTHQQGLDALAWQIVSALRDLVPVGDERWGKVLDALVQQPQWGIVDRTEHGCCGAARSAAIELAKIRGWAGDLRGEEVAAQQLLSEAERAGDQRGIAEALAVLGHALGWQGRFDAAENVLVRSVDMAAAAAQSSWMSQSLALLACLDACRGHLISARTRCAQAAASNPPNDPTIARCGEFIELLAGDLTMARAHARHAERQEPAARTPVAVRLAAWAAMAAAERGDLTEARRHLSGMSCIDSRTLGIVEPLYWWAKGVVARAEGRLITAVTALQRAVEGYSAMGAYALMGFALVDLAEVTVGAGDGETAASVARLAEDSVHCTGAPIHQTLHLLTSAWTLIRRGRREAAAQAASGAIEEFGSRGYVLLAARAHGRAILDGVHLDLADAEGFAAVCRPGRWMIRRSLRKWSCWVCRSFRSLMRLQAAST